MLLIRDVFRCKPGKAAELARRLQQTIPSSEAEDGFRNSRVLVDYVGSYWTVVLEAEAEDLSRFDHHMSGYATRPAVQEAMRGYTDLVSEGHRDLSHPAGLKPARRTGRISPGGARQRGSGRVTPAPEGRMGSVESVSGRRGARCAAPRARFWSVAPAWLALALAIATGAAAQVPGHPGPPERIGSIPLVLGDHGDPAPAIPLGLTVVGLAVYDIATAPASARWHNQRRPGASRSPGTALALSLASTAAPILVGTAVGMSGAVEAGAVLVPVGVVLGPSVGHWYAGRVGRGLTTAALRAGLSVLAGLALLSAS